MAYFYFNRDSPFKVEAFAVDKVYEDKTEFQGLPVVNFDNVEFSFSPKEFLFFIALGPGKINQHRSLKFHEAKKKGYDFASYISPSSSCESSLGKNCFVADMAVINPFVEIGDNNFFWESCVVSNNSTIQDNCYLSPNSYVGTFCTVGNNTLLGASATLKSNVHVGMFSLIGAGCYITKDTERNSVYGRRESEFLGCISDKVDLNQTF
jgi:UDP-3-O-[3-hydroxymyristoyl] glucosamine N-acyltransferase